MTSGLVTSGQASRQSQVNEQFDNLERGLKRLDEIVAKAESRYCSITRQEQPGPGIEKEKQIREALVPIADRMRGLTDTLHGLTNRLDSLIDRAEN